MRTRTPPRREREVLVMVAASLSNREIAARLGLALGTVRSYRERLRARGYLPKRGDAVG
jgi:DNA-binding CsgD family transcriptional regulator